MSERTPPRGGSQEGCWNEPRFLQKQQLLQLSRRRASLIDRWSAVLELTMINLLTSAPQARCRRSTDYRHH